MSEFLLVLLGDSLHPPPIPHLPARIGRIKISTKYSEYLRIFQSSCDYNYQSLMPVEEAFNWYEFYHKKRHSNSIINMQGKHGQESLKMKLLYLNVRRKTNNNNYDEWKREEKQSHLYFHMKQYQQHWHCYVVCCYFCQASSITFVFFLLFYL